MVFNFWSPPPAIKPDKSMACTATSFTLKVMLPSMITESLCWYQEHRYVEECGVMNVFFVIGEEVVTPLLSGTILSGITRDSVITLLHDIGYGIKEERIAIDEVFRSHERGELRECFGTGTAATVSHIRHIQYRNETIKLPPIEERKVGPLVREKLLGIMTGRQPDLHGWVEQI